MFHGVATIITVFLLACSVYGVLGTCFDILTGRASIKAQVRRHLQSLPPGFNPCYANLRRRGLSHEACVARGEPPIRPDDYYEQRLAQYKREYEYLTRKGNTD